MKTSKRNKLQLAAFIIVALNCIIYGMYIRGSLEWRSLSPSDLNPYGGWSHLKAAFTDVSYRRRGITKGMALTGAVTLTSLFAGRFLCGSICPVGTLQDFMNHLGDRLGIKGYPIGFEKEKRLDYIKYGVLLLVMTLSIMGFGSLIAPYSPWLGLMNIFSGLATFSGIAVVGIIGLASLFTKRIFCRFLCPLGAYQSLVSALGLWSIKTQAECKTCTYCLKDCPVEIRAGIKGEIPPECVCCMKCVESDCIKDPDGFRVYLGKRRIGTGTYLALGLAILLLSFSLLPLVGSEGKTGWTTASLSLQDGSYIGVGTGFAGRILADITIQDGRIDSITIREHRESSGYYEEVFKGMGREILQGQNINVDTVSGATATSRGYLNAVRNGISQSMEKRTGE